MKYRIEITKSVKFYYDVEVKSDECSVYGSLRDVAIGKALAMCDLEKNPDKTSVYEYRQTDSQLID